MSRGQNVEKGANTRKKLYAIRRKVKQLILATNAVPLIAVEVACSSANEP